MKAIDIHHHYVPKQLIDETKKHGKSLGRRSHRRQRQLGAVLRRQQPASPAAADLRCRQTSRNHGRGPSRLATLEANTNSLGYRLNGAQGEAWCNLYNECTDSVEAAPGSFHRHGRGAAAGRQRARRRVLEHAIVDLKFRGAFIGTNVNGQYYNVTDFDPFWAKAQELDIMIVMHPEHIAGAERMTQYGLNAVCGNPADSTLSLGYMFYSGLFDRFPNLKICAAARRRLSALPPRPLQQRIRNRQKNPPSPGKKSA